MCLDHSPKRAQIQRTCETCGKPFMTWRSEIRRGGGRFCSHKCAGVALRRRAIERRGFDLTEETSEPQANQESIELPSLICGYCGERFTTTEERIRNGAQYCSYECAYAARTHTDAKEVLLAHREIDPQTGCWNWNGALSGGYGQLGFNRDGARAHRLSAHVFLGMPLDSPLFVCHHCDNRKCFNPDHLFLGTAADNMQDAVSKHRMVSGERVHCSKLTANDIRVIRELLADGISQYEIGARFGVTQPTISAIARRKTWKDVPQ